MSEKLRPHYADQKGAIALGFDGNIVLAEGATVPTDATAGYAPGCVFYKRAGGAFGGLYVNEGTALSSDFNLMNAAGVNLTGLTATAAELNQAVGDGDEVVITTNIITADENGKTFYLSLAGGFASTLPAPALGLRFRFVVKTAPTTAYTIGTNAGDNVMFGMMVERAGGAGVAGAARDVFNFVANQAIVGDWVEFYCDGTNWYYHGMVDVAAGNTVGQT